MGLEFLNDLNQADLLIHIVDISGSTNEKGEQCPPLSHDPRKDVKFLEHELDHWFFNIIKKGWERFAKEVMTENQNIKKALAKQLSGLRVTEEIVEEAIKKLKLTHHPNEWSEDDLFQLASELRKQTKPIIIAANKIDVPGSKLNLHKLQQEFPDYLIIPCSSESELALREAAKNNLVKYTPGSDSFEITSKNINEKQKKALEFIKNFLKEFKSTGIQDILDKAVFEKLKHIAVFPVPNNNLQDKDGKCLPDCHLLIEGSNTLDLAYKIHQDIAKNFIKAIDIRTKRIVGKDHILKHRDIIEIMANT